MSLRDDMRKDAEEYGMSQSSNLFQFEKSGSYRLRILTNPVAIATHFFGKGQGSHVCYGMHKGCPFHDEGAPKDKDGNPKSPSVKYMAYVIDRSDGRVKIGELPWSVISRFADFEEDEDFKFDSYPMPYDIKVKVDKENKDPKSIYKTDASPQKSELTPEEADAFMAGSKKITPAQFVEKRKEKELAKQMADGSWQRAADERKARIANAEAMNKEAASNDGVDEASIDDYPESEGAPLL